jgi:hypothetical protein
MGIKHTLAEGLIPVRRICGDQAHWTIWERMTHYNVPAVSVAVIDDFKIQVAQAWRVLENGYPDQVQLVSLFQTASINKSITAVWPAVSMGRDCFALLELEGQISGFNLWFGLPDWSLYRQWYFEKL